jgi:biotin operon repressor BirA-like protein
VAGIDESSPGADEPLVRRVFTALADGADHSGEQIAALAGVSRSAVRKAIERLRELGLDVEAATNRGYRLKSACEALDAARIAALAPDCEVHVGWSLASTNATLLAETRTRARQLRRAAHRKSNRRTRPSRSALAGRSSRWQSRVVDRHHLRNPAAARSSAGVDAGDGVLCAACVG